MTRTEFLARIDRILNLPPGATTGEQVLDELEGWDSLAVMGFIAMVDESLNLVVSAQDLRKCRTVNDLVTLAQPRLAA